MSHTAVELRKLAKELGLRGYSTAKKARLVEMLEEHSKAVEAQKAAASKAEEKPAEPEPEKDEDTKSAFVAEEKKEEPKEKKAAPARRTPSVWNQFLAAYRSEHGCSLKEAMKQKDAYEVYKQKHQKKAAE